MARVAIWIGDRGHRRPRGIRETSTGRHELPGSGYRAVTIVPMLRGDARSASLALPPEARPFTEKQIALLPTLRRPGRDRHREHAAAQRMRQRTDDLTESLEQQTATSEVLKVISSSPGELEPVFQAMLENATRICEAKFGS